MPITATAMQPFIDQHRRALDWHGWIAANALACPRQIAGLPCLGAPGCLCVTPRVVDHPARWITSEGTEIFTSERYDLPPAAAFNAWGRECEKIGLPVRVWTPDKSIWNPGSTHLIIAGSLTQAEQAHRWDCARH